MLTVQFVSEKLPTSGVMAAAVGEDKALPVLASDLKSLLSSLPEADFTGQKGQVVMYAQPVDKGVTRRGFAGLGNLKEITPLTVQEAGGKWVASCLMTDETAHLAVGKTLKSSKVSETELAAHLAYGALLRAYTFLDYRTKEQGEFKFPKLKTIVIHVSDSKAVEKAFQPLKALAEGVYFTRHLQSEPANVIYPASFIERAEAALADSKIKVKVLGEKEMQKLGLNALLGVGQGSARESQLLVLEYMGGDKKAPVTALVGKGVTFDTGGISIKPANNMEDMKWDMGGAGVVVGTMQALAANKVPLNVVGLCGLVENMPSGTAQRPGDVVKSLSGQTIEVINTDAEGRLVLSDVLWYAQDTYKPATIIDFATLTGAIVVALGEVTAGLFSNDDALADALLAASAAVGEPIWRLPMREEYDRDIDSDIADMKNVGSGRGAGSITAAHFLNRFIKPETKWAHIDIAGVTWAKKPTALTPKGATAFGVRLAYEFLVKQAG